MRLKWNYICEALLACLTIFMIIIQLSEGETDKRKDRVNEYWVQFGKVADVELCCTTMRIAGTLRSQEKNQSVE